MTGHTHTIKKKSTLSVYSVLSKVRFTLTNRSSADVNALTCWLSSSVSSTRCLMLIFRHSK
jgi:hypothetical protein